MKNEKSFKSHSQRSKETVTETKKKIQKGKRPNDENGQSTYKRVYKSGSQAKQHSQYSESITTQKKTKNKLLENNTFSSSKKSTMSKTPVSKVEELKAVKQTHKVQEENVQPMTVTEQSCTGEGPSIKTDNEIKMLDATLVEHKESTLLLQDSSTDAIKNVKRAASAPIGAVSSYMDLEQPNSGRRGSGPTRCQGPDRILDRHAGLDRSKGPSSLPSSPSRMRSQTQGGSIQLLTSEVFTRTVDATGGIEVIFRQPSDHVRRLPKTEALHSDIGEFSMIDTTDSSLSDSVALPSSSSDHDLSVDTSYRLRTSISPCSPKFSRRSRETISPKIRQSDIAECATVPEGDTSEIEFSPIRTSPIAVPFDRQVSTPTRLVDRSCTGKTPTRSEDRLSPILDVRSITPPRLKHKFTYASSDEEDTSIGKPRLEAQPSSSQVLMEPSSVHSMPLPSEINTQSHRKSFQDRDNQSPIEFDLESSIGVGEDFITFQTVEECYSDELPTISTSGSDGDCAILESNILKAIYEEESTDEDPEIIPKDDSLKEDVITHFNELPQEETSIETVDMASDESKIPIISITTTDDVSQSEYKRCQYQPSPEPLTDLEDIDHDTIQPVIGKLKINVEDDNALTDAELVEASDEDDDKSAIQKSPVQIDHVMDYGGSYDELIRLTSSSSIHQKDNFASSVTASKSSESRNYLNTFYEKDGTTDFEDFGMSDEEDNGDENICEVNDDDDILSKMLDDETVDIADRVRNSPVPSPVVTPDISDKHQRKGRSRKNTVTRRKKTNDNYLYPKSPSPHLSDFTDTEIVFSDSEEDNIIKERPLSPQERRKKQKQSKEMMLNKHKQAVIKVPDASLSLESEISSVYIIEKVPVDEVISESDTDNIYSVPRKHIIYAPKKKTLLMEVAGALMKETFASTDVEHFEGSNESDEDSMSQVSEQNYNSVDSQCEYVKEKQSTKNRLKLPKQDRVVLTDTEDVETEDEMSNRVHLKKISIQGESTEEDDFEATDTEYVAAVKELRVRAWKESNYEIRFIDIDGQARPLAITPDIPHNIPSSSLLLPSQALIYTTDTEDLDGYSDLHVSKSALSIRCPERDLAMTDVETFEAEDEIFRPKSPEPSDDEISQSLPEPTREMILVKEDSIGRPVSVVLPLGNAEPIGLSAPSIELEGGTSEVEEMMTEDDETLPTNSIIRSVTPDFPDIDSSVIHTSEVIKVQKKKLKVIGDGPSEPLTDTEDLFLSVSGKRKRTKTKLRLGLEPRRDQLTQELTDTEEIIFSDVDNKRKLPTPRIETDPATDLDDLDLSGEEETPQDFQRSLAVTPEYFKELGDSYTILREGIGPFTEEARQHLLTSGNIPVINTISPSPDISFIMNTDTEDMVTSADEDGFSRAETVTPYDTGVELEDHSSFVYMKHTRKFDLDAPEEAIHIKGAIESHDTHTDVEDLGISEDERPKPPEQLFVNDTVNEVCVCLNSEVEGEDSVCVCVNKNHGGLSLVWNSKNSTDSNQHRGWAEKGKPDSAVDSSNKDTEVLIKTNAEDLGGSSSTILLKENKNSTHEIDSVPDYISSSITFQNIDLILANELNFEDSVLSSDDDDKQTCGRGDDILALCFDNERIEHIVDMNENYNLGRNISELSKKDSFQDGIFNDLNYFKENYKIFQTYTKEVTDSYKQFCLKSQNNSIKINDSDLEDSYTILDTRSNTESFSELRFSQSETHSEFNYSDSGSERSVGKIQTLNMENYCNLKEKYPYTTDIKASKIDDTTGILYEMSEQINKVPKLLTASKSVGNDFSSFQLKKHESSFPSVETDDSLEHRVLQYFSQCNKTQFIKEKGDKGEEELQKLEAAVERMMNQVVIQENLLKDDVNFVPLVLEKKEAKAFPLLVNTLCFTPKVQRGEIKKQTAKGNKYTNFNLERRAYFSSNPELCQSTYMTLDRRLEDKDSSFSIGELEKSVNKLLSEVEREEYKLNISSPDSGNICISTTATDLSSENDTHGMCVWWEGTYRSLPRHSVRKRLSKYYVNPKKATNSQNKSLKKKYELSDDSDTSTDSIRVKDNTKQSLSKLMVKTVENGKSTVEIRTCSNLPETTGLESNGEFGRIFNRGSSEAHSYWNRSLPSLSYQETPSLPRLLSLGSDHTLNSIKYIEPSDHIQYFIPCPAMDLDSTGYCTWTPGYNEGQSVTKKEAKDILQDDNSNISVTSESPHKITETVDIVTKDNAGDVIIEKDKKYQFTMSVQNKQDFYDTLSSLTTFLEGEKIYNEKFLCLKTVKPSLVENEVTSSDETEESLSKSEKSDKSFVGKMSKKLFGVFKKDDKEKTDKKKSKKKKQDKEKEVKILSTDDSNKGKPSSVDMNKQFENIENTESAESKLDNVTLPILKMKNVVVVKDQLGEIDNADLNELSECVDDKSVLVKGKLPPSDKMLSSTVSNVLVNLTGNADDKKSFIEDDDINICNDITTNDNNKIIDKDLIGSNIKQSSSDVNVDILNTFPKKHIIFQYIKKDSITKKEIDKRDGVNEIMNSSKSDQTDSTFTTKSISITLNEKLAVGNKQITVLTKTTNDTVLSGTKIVTDGIRKSPEKIEGEKNLLSNVISDTNDIVMKTQEIDATNVVLEDAPQLSTHVYFSENESLTEVDIGSDDKTEKKTTEVAEKQIKTFIKEMKENDKEFVEITSETRDEISKNNKNKVSETTKETDNGKESKDKSKSFFGGLFKKDHSGNEKNSYVSGESESLKAIEPQLDDLEQNICSDTDLFQIKNQNKSQTHVAEEKAECGGKISFEHQICGVDNINADLESPSIFQKSNESTSIDNINTSEQRLFKAPKDKSKSFFGSFFSNRFKDSNFTVPETARNITEQQESTKVGHEHEKNDSTRIGEEVNRLVKNIVSTSKESLNKSSGDIKIEIKSDLDSTCMMLTQQEQNLFTKGETPLKDEKSLDKAITEPVKESVSKTGENITRFSRYVKEVEKNIISTGKEILNESSEGIKTGIKSVDSISSQAESLLTKSETQLKDIKSQTSNIDKSICEAVKESLSNTEKNITGIAKEVNDVEKNIVSTGKQSLNKSSEGIKTGIKTSFDSLSFQADSLMTKSENKLKDIKSQTISIEKSICEPVKESLSKTEKDITRFAEEANDVEKNIIATGNESLNKSSEGIKTGIKSSFDSLSSQADNLLTKSENKLKDITSQTSSIDKSICEPVKESLSKAEKDITGFAKEVNDVEKNIVSIGKESLNKSSEGIKTGVKSAVDSLSSQAESLLTKSENKLKDIKSQTSSNDKSICEPVKESLSKTEKDITRFAEEVNDVEKNIIATGNESLNKSSEVIKTGVKSAVDSLSFQAESLLTKSENKLKDIKSQTSSIDKSICEPVKESLSKTEKDITGFAEEVNDVEKNIVSTGKESLNKSSEGITTGLKSSFDSLSSQAESLLTKSENKLKDIKSQTSGIDKSICEPVKESLSKTEKDITRFAEEVNDVEKNIVSTGKESFNKSSEGITTGLKSSFDSLSSQAESLLTKSENKLKDIKSQTSSIDKLICEPVKESLSKTEKDITGFAKEVNDVEKNIVSTGKESINKSSEDIKTGIKSSFDSLSSQTQSLLTKSENKLKDIKSQTSSIDKSICEPVKESLSKTEKDITRFAEEVNDVEKNIVSIGKESLNKSSEGIKTGVKSAVDSLSSQAESLLTKSENKLKDIKSQTSSNDKSICEPVKESLSKTEKDITRFAEEVNDVEKNIIATGNESLNKSSEVIKAGVKSAVDSLSFQAESLLTKSENKLKDIKSQTSSIDKSICEPVKESLSKTEKDITGFAEEVNDVEKNIVSTGKESLNKSSEGITTGLKSSFDSLSSQAESLLTKSENKLKDIKSQTSGIDKSICEPVKESLSKTEKDITRFAEEVNDVEKNIVSTGKESFNKSSEGITTGLKSSFDSLSSQAESLLTKSENKLKDIKSQTSSIDKSICEPVKESLSKTEKDITGFAKEVNDVEKNIVSTGKESINKSSEDIKTGIKSSFDSLSSQTQSLLTKSENKLKDIKSQTSSIDKSICEPLKESLSKTEKDITRFAEEVNDVEKNIVSIGKESLNKSSEGIKTGVKSAVDSLSSQAESLLTKSENKLKDIKSQTSSNDKSICEPVKESLSKTEKDITRFAEEVNDVEKNIIATGNESLNKSSEVIKTGVKSAVDSLSFQAESLLTKSENKLKDIKSQTSSIDKSICEPVKESLSKTEKDITGFAEEVNDVEKNIVSTGKESLNKSSEGITTGLKSSFDSLSSQAESLLTKSENKLKDIKSQTSGIDKSICEPVKESLSKTEKDITRFAEEVNDVEKNIVSTGKESFNKSSEGITTGLKSSFDSLSSQAECLLTKSENKLKDTKSQTSSIDKSICEPVKESLSKTEKDITGFAKEVNDVEKNIVSTGKESINKSSEDIKTGIKSSFDSLSSQTQSLLTKSENKLKDIKSQTSSIDKSICEPVKESLSKTEKDITRFSEDVNDVEKHIVSTGKESLNKSSEGKKTGLKSPFDSLSSQAESLLTKSENKLKDIKSQTSSIDKSICEPVKETLSKTEKDITGFTKEVNDVEKNIVSTGKESLNKSSEDIKTGIKSSFDSLSSQAESLLTKSENKLMDIKSQTSSNVKSICEPAKESLSKTEKDISRFSEEVNDVEKNIVSTGKESLNKSSEGMKTVDSISFQTESLLTESKTQDLRSDNKCPTSCRVDNVQHKISYDLGNGSERVYCTSTVQESTKSGEHLRTNTNEDKLNNILIDMLIEQECMKNIHETPSSPTSSGDQNNQKNYSVPSNVNTKKSVTISQDPNLQGNLKSIASYSQIKTLISDSDMEKNSKAFKGEHTSYVTTPTMQRRKIGGSQRLSREERPALRDVSHILDYSSSEEDEINQYIVTEPSDQLPPRKVIFHVESEDEAYLKVSDTSSEPEVEVTEMSPSPDPISKKQGKVSIEGKVQNIDDLINSRFKSDQNIQKVERRFERMASETLDTDPVSKITADREFQRMVSQLSNEEVEAYINQWEEEGLTPSDELDSTSHTVEGDLDLDVEALPEASLGSTNPFYNSGSQWVDLNHDIQDVPSIFWAFNTSPTSAVIQPNQLDIPVKPISITGESVGEDAKKESTPSATRGARPSLKYDISMDEEPEFDPREHDWRFNLPSHPGSEGEEVLLDLATGLQEPKGSVTGSATPSTK